MQGRGLAVAAVAFTLMGVFMLGTDDPTDRVVGLAFLLFGVGAATTFAVGRRDRRSGPRIAEVGVQGRRTRCVLIPIRRAKLMLTAVAALAFGVAMTLIPLVANDVSDRYSPMTIRLVGYGGGAFFFGIAAFEVFAAIRGGAGMYLTSGAIIHRGGGLASVAPWDVITDVGAFEFMGNQMLGLHVSDATRIDVEGPTPLRALGAGFSGWDLTYGDLFDITLDEVRDLIIHYLEHPEERARLDTITELPAVATTR